MYNKKKILALTEPPITTFPSYAAILGILSNYAETFDWIYSHYINLCTIALTNVGEDGYTVFPYIPSFFIDTDTRRLTNVFADSFLIIKEGCPYLTTFELPNILLDSFGISFVSLIKKSIELDMYLYTYLDITKIKQYKSENIPSGFHEVFIYGFDDEKRVIYFADFPINDNAHYSHSTCSYDEIENAFIGMRDYAYPITKSIALIKYTNNVPFVFDFSYVKNTIHEYLYPDRVKAKNHNDYVMSLFHFLNWKTKTYLGVDVYNFFIDFIDDELKKKSGYFTLELFHGLYDHKVMMIKRLEYFISKCYLVSAKADKLDEYRKVKDNALRVRNLILKYNMRKQEAYLERAKLLLSDTRVLEEKLLKEIFDM